MTTSLTGLAKAQIRNVPVPLTVQALPGFDSAEHGLIDIPDATAINTEYSLQFGASSTGASMVLLINSNNQDCYFKLNGSTEKHGIAAGGFILIASPALPTLNKLVSMKVGIPAQQSGDGKISYVVVGS